MTDPIADMLTRIRNANKAGHESVQFQFSNLKLSVTEVLKKQGFIEATEKIEQEKKNFIQVKLKYGPKKERVILGLKRISKCGRRHYTNKEQIPYVQGGLGIAILSTSKGIMTDKDARKENVGGEVLCYVW